MIKELGFQLPEGIQPVNPVPVDSWSGPYTGVTEALSSIPIEIRFPTMEVRILDPLSGNSIYWFKNGVQDSDFVVMSRGTSDIENEIQARISGDTVLFNMITGETTNRISSDNLLEDSIITLNNDITGETATRISQDTVLNNLITGETFNRTTGDTRLNNMITGETANRVSQDTVLNSLITGETANRITGDTRLNNLITGETASRVSQDTVLNSLITGETSARISQDNILNNLITGETAARISQDVILNNLITGETANRVSNDIVLNNLITGETASRISSDNVLNSSLTGLTNNFNSHTGNTSLHLTTSQNTLLDGISGVTFTEINYLSGLTGNTQEQINTEIANRISNDEMLFNMITGDPSNPFYDMLTGETAARISGDTNLYNLITGETFNRTTGDTKLNNLITGETTSRISSDTILNNSITGLTSNFNSHTGNTALHLTSTQNTLLDGIVVTYTEINYSSGLSGNTQQQLTKETLNRTTGDTLLNNLITGETANRANADTAIINNFNSHTGNTALHLTSTQNTLLDGIVVTFAEINYSSGLSGNTQQQLTKETLNRTTGDTLLNNLITGETANRVSQDTILNNLITGETFNRTTGDTRLNNLITGETASRTTADTTLNNLITGETASRISADSNLQTQINSKSDTGHTHYKLYQPNGSNPFVYTDNNNTLHIDGNIVQSGSTYETHAEQIYTSKDYIYLRSGATFGLAIGQFAGFEAIKYDGVNNGRLVFDNNGVARVGDVSHEQALTTREETPTHNYLTFWNSGTTRLETINPLDLPISTLANNAITGETANRVSQDVILNNLITGETANRIAVDTTLNNAITGETTNRISQDIILNNSITGLSATVTTNYGLLTGETFNRISADNLLNNSITGLSSTVLNNYNLLTGETENRINNDNYLDLNKLSISGGTVTGNLNVSGASINTNGIFTDYIAYNTGETPDLSVGMRRWNNSVGTTELLLKGGRVTLQDGQELNLYVYNSGDTAIYNGDAVTIIGSYNNYEAVTLAVAGDYDSDNDVDYDIDDDTNSFIVNGVATETINVGEYGYVTYFGQIHDLDLSKFDMGEEVYLSQKMPGDLTHFSELNISGRACKIGTVINNSSVNGILRLDIVNESNIARNSLMELNTFTANDTSTGVFDFSGMTLNSPTTFSIPPTKGWISQNEDNPLEPNIIFINFTGATNITTPYLTTNTVTYILLDSFSNLILQPTLPTPIDRRNYIYLGRLAHINKTSITTIFHVVDNMLSPISQLRDMFIPIPLINGGVLAYPNTGMTFNNTGGVLYGLGISFPINKKDPNRIVVQGGVETRFQYRTQTGGTSTVYTNVDPAHYDVNGVITSVGTIDKRSTNQRIYLIQDGSFRIQYGQSIYINLSSAVAAATSEDYITFPNIRDNGILIGILSLTLDATDLTDLDQAKFLPVSKFGETVGAAGGISTSTLQSSYNNSPEPEILTNRVNKALTIRRGSDFDSDDLITFQNGVGSVVASVDAFGIGSFSSIIKSGGTEDQYLMADGSILTTGDTQQYYDNRYVNVTGDTINGDLNINGLFLQNTFTLSGITGDTIVYQVDKNKGNSMFVDYVIKSNDTNALRAGNLTAVWDGSNVEFTEYGTNDLNSSTSDVIFNVDIDGDYVRLLSTITANIWTIKIGCKIL